MLPSAKKYLVKSGYSPHESAWILLGCFMAGFIGIQIFSMAMHHFIPSHVVCSPSILEKTMLTRLSFRLSATIPMKRLLRVHQSVGEHPMINSLRSVTHPGLFPTGKPQNPHRSLTQTAQKTKNIPMESGVMTRL